MFASSRGPHPAARRRGIVLVLVLGMLGLMALIGVTFAAFAGQSLKNSRNYSQGAARPQGEALMDFALAQLISDSSNPLSAIRGHSLLRDMYGNDSVYRGSNPTSNAVASLLVNGVFDRAYGTFLSLSNGRLHPTPTPFYGQIQYTTNIPTGGQYAGLDFTRWTLRIAPGNAVPQTFEVLEDFPDASTGFHQFTLSANLGSPGTDSTNTLVTNASSDTRSFIYRNPNVGMSDNSGDLAKSFSSLAAELNGSNFVLDGRYMRAFNGPGLTRPVAAAPSVDASGNVVAANANYPYNQAAYGNMRVADFNPDSTGMDEDYDACDLENWFLAIQSADGQVMIPSFHRPGILTAADWTVPAFDTSGAFINRPQRAKILRPRQVDHSPLFPADPSAPDTAGKLTYDIDNDGDGVTDSVWLDLGYPAQRDVNGKLSKPLFAFMMLGLNGRLPLNTVGNLQARAIGDTTNNPPAADNVPFPASSGQVPYPGLYAANGNHNGLLSSQVFFDTPLHDHTSHLGYSVNEINPKFALQNAPSNLYPPIAQDYVGGSYSQIDNAGVSVAVTQLRNLLAGGMASDLKYPYTGAISGTPQFGTLAGTSIAGSVAAARSGGEAQNNDINFVAVNGQPYVLPNGMADAFDLIPTSTTNVLSTMPTIAGRWGEPEGIPRVMYLPGTYNDADTTYPMLRYANRVRAGRSYYVANDGTNDGMDDDFDAFDPYLPTAAVDDSSVTFTVIRDKTSYTGGTATPDQLPVASTSGTFATATFSRNNPEDVDRFDGSGQGAVAVERIRRFVTPIDPGGVGRMVKYMDRPNRDHDFGKGADTLGRTSFFRYFRPAGMPQEVLYPFNERFNPTTGLPIGFGATYATSSASGIAPNPNSGLGQRYLAPILIPAGRARPEVGVPVVSTPDVRSNALHGFQAQATPDTQGTGGTDPKAQTIATMAAMPYDWDPRTAQIPNGYGDQAIAETATVSGRPITLYSPTIYPTVPYLRSKVNSVTGPNLGAVGADGTTYPIPYVPGTVPSDYPSNYTGGVPNSSMVVNGYIGGSLNKDEADEMNLYVSNTHDMPYGPTDLEWLYRKHDVDGSSLSSRLGQLAPISFLNPADGLTRRRLFSVDTWDLNTFAYANDNPVPYAGVMGLTAPYSGIHTPDHDFSYNSRFGPNASPSFENINQAVGTDGTTSPITYNTNFANPISTEFLANPTLPIQTYSADGSGNSDSFLTFVANSAAIDAGQILPLTLNTTDPALGKVYSTAVVAPYTSLIDPSQTPSTRQVQTPTVAHRDRRINLNYPLPLSVDPAEPVRQKWCRETYRMLKAILPPAAVDTPEELAQLSQFVVNIVDFRDTDCAMTRFVNTDLVITDALTKSTDPLPLNAGTGYDLADATRLALLNVSPMGVKFAQASDLLPSGRFPYDPSIYNPDQATKFLVQHGMEYNPIAINETIALQYQYPLAKGDRALGGICRGLFIELINTLTESQNESFDTTGTPPSSVKNSSAVDLTGWDLIITPDNYGWGRPDPITGDVPVYACPPQRTGTFVATTPTTAQPSANGQEPTVARVQQFRFTTAGGPRNKIRAINGDTANTFGVIGAYTTTATGATGVGQSSPPALAGGSATDTVESNPIVRGETDADGATGAMGATPKLDVVLPASMIPELATVAPTSGSGAYFWIYLRRPANPLDIDDLASPRINREMVVVDAMRFPYIDTGAGVTFSGSASDPSNPTNPEKVATTQTDTAFSSSRLQPFRGGHLVRKDTPAPVPPVSVSPGTTVSNIAPPSPAYAYGYSEQTLPPTTGTNHVQWLNTAGTPYNLSKNIQETIGAANAGGDANWAHLPFHDRDFVSVAELLLVPGCPPGLFTKQFVEEPYPGHAAADATPAVGWDSRDLQPIGNSVPALKEVGQKDFGYSGNLPAAMTFPYLTDNFYYTAASVNPPLAPPNQARLTTEIGGWTGTGWHKMLEFFEVPTSANGAIGTADVGNNYDWYRADVRPGQLNLNLILDEEVLAGLIDDPRLNETLAHLANGTATTMPFVVSQIDYNGHPTYRYPIFPTVTDSQSTNGINNTLTKLPFGRGYVMRDPLVTNYPGGPPYNYQQVHGLKAALSDYLKLLHGGSGHLFAHGAGDVGMGDINYTGTLADGSNSFQTFFADQPVAADRPFRSLSYPDINYTIMRPASLPPAPEDTVNVPKNYRGTFPVLPPGLANLFSYTANAVAPFVQLSPPVAPRADPSSPYQYVHDPGIRNPYLDVQFHDTLAATSGSIPVRRLAPPYDVSSYNVAGGHLTVSDGTAGQAQPAPFPPTIPPTPARRLFQIPDVTTSTLPTSNASLDGQQNPLGTYTVNRPTRPRQLSTGGPLLSVTDTTVPLAPPSLVAVNRPVFAADNFTPQAQNAANNFLGDGPGISDADPTVKDLRMHPGYRTELLQKMMNLTTVRTHQFATWITVGFFEVIKTGTPELGIPDVLGQEVGAAAGNQVRFRSFFVIDRTKATGFNPYSPGNFRDCVTYRRRIE